jgi:hypothetical protein
MGHALAEAERIGVGQLAGDPFVLLNVDEIAELDQTGRAYLAKFPAARVDARAGTLIPCRS